MEGPAMSEQPSAARFPTTCWGRILQAGDPSAPESRAALDGLCRDYWYPLYACVRHKGHDPHTAQDLVQGFFAALLEREVLATIDRSKGRFRSFLMAACTHYLANQRDHDRRSSGVVDVHRSRSRRGKPRGGTAANRATS
jgi:RNA polymerase sigma-70 factor (ECF subfamily)